MKAPWRSASSTAAEQHLVVHVDVVGRVLGHDAVARDEQLERPHAGRRTAGRRSRGARRRRRRRPSGRRRRRGRRSRRSSARWARCAGPGISPRSIASLASTSSWGWQHAGADDERVAALEERPGRPRRRRARARAGGAAATPPWSNTKSSGQLMWVCASPSPGSTVAPRRSTIRTDASSTSSRPLDTFGDAVALDEDVAVDRPLGRVTGAGEHLARSSRSVRSAMLTPSWRPSVRAHHAPLPSCSRMSECLLLYSTGRQPPSSQKQGQIALPAEAIEGRNGVEFDEGRHESLHERHRELVGLVADRAERRQPDGQPVAADAR